MSSADTSSPLVPASALGTNSLSVRARTTSACKPTRRTSSISTRSLLWSNPVATCEISIARRSAFCDALLFFLASMRITVRWQIVHSFLFYYTKSTISSTLYFHHLSLFFSIISIKKYKNISEKGQNRFSFHKKGVILPLDWGCSRHTCCLNKKLCNLNV